MLTYKVAGFAAFVLVALAGVAVRWAWKMGKGAGYDVGVEVSYGHGVRVGYERGARETLDNIQSDAKRAEAARQAAMTANRRQGQLNRHARNGKGDPNRPAAQLVREFLLPSGDEGAES